MIALHNYRVSNLENWCQDTAPFFCLPSNEKGATVALCNSTMDSSRPIQSFLFITFVVLFARRSLLGHAKIHRETAVRERVPCWITAKARMMLSYVLVP